MGKIKDGVSGTKTSHLKPHFQYHVFGSIKSWPSVLEIPNIYFILINCIMAIR